MAGKAFTEIFEVAGRDPKMMDVSLKMIVATMPDAAIIIAMCVAMTRSELVIKDLEKKIFEGSQSE